MMVVDNHTQHFAGLWLPPLLSLVSVLGQEAEQVGIVRAGQYAVAIQGVFPDGVSEAGSGLIAGVCTDPFPDGVGQALAGAAFYVEVYFHALRQRLVLGIILGGGNSVLGGLHRLLRQFLGHGLGGFLGRFRGVLGGFLGHRLRIGGLGRPGLALPGFGPGFRQGAGCEEDLEGDGAGFRYIEAEVAEFQFLDDRCNHNRENRQNPLRTDAGGLLTGLIYCGECGERLTFNHCRKVVENSTGRHEYTWDVYRCFRKINYRGSCAGQSTYAAWKIEDVVLDVVRSFFDRIRRIPEASQLKAAMRREESTQAKALADAAAAVDKAAKAVAALEDQAIKALTGESQLDLGIINQLMPKQKATLEAAREEYQRVLMVNQAEEEMLEAKRLQARKMAEWGQLFEDAPLSQKQMILAEIIDRVEVRRGYQVTIKFKLTARQFLEPDADAAGDQKAS